MIFNSYIFVLLFFPISLLIYLRLYFGKYEKGIEIAKVIMTLLSLLFYLYAGVYGFLILFTLCIANFIFFRLLLWAKGKGLNMHKCVLGFSILLNLLVLLYLKYYNFFVDNINFLFKTKFQIHEIIMPLGISFITFQNIAFLVDVYRQEVVKCSFLEYMFYIAYFPKISSGPITRFADLSQLITKENKEDFWNNIASGFYLFVMGLGKKVLIADQLLKVTNMGYQHVGEINTPTALLVSLAYTFQIYFDFSGYSDMAIGISRMMQIRLSENFNSPYKAKNIEEFWDRWHISLTKFFTKYLYIPLGGNRKGGKRTYLNIVLVFLCSGLWHGASWTFFLWGGVHGAAMVFNRMYKNTLNKIPSLVSQLITFLFVNFTWIIFKSGDLHTLKGMCQAIVKGGWGEVSPIICSTFKLGWVEKLFDVCISDVAYLIMFLIVLGIIVFFCKNATEKAGEQHLTIWNAIWVLVIFMSCLLSFSHVTAYIYTRF